MQYAIGTMHCEACASTDREDLETGDQGYTACCNEPVVWGGGCESGRCTHGELAAVQWMLGAVNRAEHFDPKLNDRLAHRKAELLAQQATDERNDRAEWLGRIEHGTEEVR